MGALSDALASLSHHTPAKPGDRTLMDALYPLCTTTISYAEPGRAGSTDTSATAVESSGSAGSSDFTEACKRAHDGALSTKGMKPRLGRAVYVELKEGLEHELPPDPGAWGVSVLVNGFWDGFCGMGRS